jgi:hypothetical protein
VSAVAVARIRAAGHCFIEAFDVRMRTGDPFGQAARRERVIRRGGADARIVSETNQKRLC